MDTVTAEVGGRELTFETGHSSTQAPLDKVMAVRSCGTLVAVGEAVAAGQDGLIFRPRKVLL